MKKKQFLIAWLLVIILLIVVQIFILSTKSDGEIAYGKIIEDRNLTQLEEEYFTDFFINNSGFLENFYENASDVTIPMLIEKNQGLDKAEFLDLLDMQKIMSDDLKDIENYELYYNRPTELFNMTLSGKNLRSLYKEKTNMIYKKNVEDALWSYNKKLDIYYNTVAYDFSTSINKYIFKNIKITNNNIYQIEYIAHYVPDSSSTDGKNENYKSERYSGVLTLKKNRGLYFVANKMTDNTSYVSMLSNFNTNFDFSTVIATVKEDSPKKYFDKSKEIEVKKFNAKDIAFGYVYSVVSDGLEELYYFNNDDLILYEKIVGDEKSYYYFQDNINVKYVIKDNEKVSFATNLRSLEKSFSDIKNRSKMITEFMEQ